MAAVPISVITGFLGSGKTTLLAKLLRDPALARTAVIINEFGAVGLDHLLVEASDEEIVSLDSGCVCCTVRGDLVRTARDLLARRAVGAVVAFERIVIETTGLADPAPILQALMTDPALADTLCLESVIATVDAAAGAATLDAHPESVKQAAVADRIVVTKTDLTDPAANGLAERLHALNPRALQLTAVHGAVDASRLFDGGLYDPAARGPDVRRWLATETVPYDPADHDHTRHDAAVTSFCLRRSAPLRAVTLTLFLELLAEHCGARLLRLKGLVDVLESPGRPAVIHGVQHVFHPPTWLDAWPDGDHTTRIVVIALGLDPRWLEALLDALDNEVAALQAGGMTAMGAATNREEKEGRCSIS
jgi:G3E family GTPase